MKEFPILFSTPMVRALLEGRKTQTRRILKPQPTDEWMQNTKQFSRDGKMYDLRGKQLYWISDGVNGEVKNPYGKPGDILWVRETWAELDEPDSFGKYLYKANDDTPEKWKPSIFMPRAACRLRLEITDVRVERLQEISRAAAAAEGICLSDPKQYFPGYQTHRWPEENYATLWNNINTKPGTRWEDNPFVWVITFKKL